MSEKANKDATAEAANALLKVIADAEKAGENKQTGEKGLPPVHLWEPDYCGDIGMKIARDGQWYYANSPIGRKKLVRLFSTILRHDEDGEHYLVSPVEKIRVEVEDAPFVATLMHVSGEGQAQVLRFETNVGDFTEAGPEHPLVALCEVVDAQFGVWSHGVFFALAAAEDVQTADDSASA
jgi:hypothetical protein